MVVRITDIDGIALTNENTGRKPEFTDIRTFVAYIQQEVAGPIEDLKSMEQRIRHVDVSKVIHGNAFGSGQITTAISMMTELFDEVTVVIEYLDTEVHGIGNQQSAAFIQPDHSWIIEFTVSYSPFAKTFHQLAICCKNIYLMSRGIDDKQSAVSWIDGQSGWLLKTSAEYKRHCFLLSLSYHENCAEK